MQCSAYHILENHTLPPSWKLRLTKSSGESKNDFGDRAQCNKLALREKNATFADYRLTAIK